MSDTSKLLIKKYFDDSSFIAADIRSFNHFIEVELQKIIEENRVIEPTIIPSNVEEYKILLDKISITKPEMTEADGSKRIIYPMEARLRKLSYSAPVFIEISSHINGAQRESFRTQIGSIPVMLKSKYCHLHGLSKDELIEKGEDPDDPGGYFIINGTEKALVKIEDLAANKFLVSESGGTTTQYEGKVFSERGSYKIPHTVEKLKDGVVYLSFTRVKRIPLVVIIKALGVVKDEDIMKYIELEDSSEVFINLYEFVDIKTEDDAVDYIAKRIGIMQTKEIRMERTREILDKYLLPHIGLEKKDRLSKAQNLCKMMKKYVLVHNGFVPPDDRDHYMNKRLKMSGDLLADLIRANLKILIGDMLYNFQRIVKRGKFPNLKVIIRDKLLTQRVYSSMATGSWVGGRKGISQRMERLNFLQVQSTLQRVISPLSASQENFEARTLHPTHLGRLCPAETPEGTNIGLRKNLALLASITQEVDEDEVLKTLKGLGLEAAK
jgi:DNA-directed RNA polymerase beta subunit